MRESRYLPLYRQACETATGLSMSVQAAEIRELLETLSQRTDLLAEWKDIAYRSAQAHTALTTAFEALSARYHELEEDHKDLLALAGAEPEDNNDDEDEDE